MRFKARVGSEYRDVNVVFGKEADVRAVSRWRAGKNAPAAVRDAAEFARLASKRWRYYHRSIPCSETLQDLTEATKRKTEAEICLILIAKADWFSRTQALGLAQCRRTFSNNLLIEFLSVHPRVILGAEPAVRGIGSGLIYTLAAVAKVAGIKRIWGEATANSAPFYKRIFQLREVSDLFVAEGKSLQVCATRFGADVFGELEI